MINLLPPEDKRQIRAARANSLLLRYNILLLGAIVFLFLAIGGVYVYLQSTKTSAEQTISDNESKVAGFSKVQGEAEQFKSNLTIAKQILDKEVTYTSVILKISHLLPSGVVLDSLNLDSATFGTATTLTAKAKNYNDAIALKNAFQDSDIFTDVHFQSISTSSGSDSSSSSGTDSSSSDYPVTINLSVVIKKEAVQ